MSYATSVRFPDDVHDSLRERADGQRRTVSDVIVQYVTEGLAMDAHPGVVFRSGPGGRRPGLAGGPDVAEVIDAVRAVDGSGEAAIAEAAADIGIDTAQVRLGVSYYGAHAAEVDAEIARRRRALDDGEAAHRQANALLG